MKGILSIVVLMIIGFSAMANAQCAWVLWEQSQFTSQELKNDSYMDWYIVAAFPTANACWQQEEDICMRRAELASENSPNQDPLFKPKDVKCFKSWGGHMESWTNQRGFWMSQWKCLPDTIDPRK